MKKYTIIFITSVILSSNLLVFNNNLNINIKFHFNKYFQIGLNGNSINESLILEFYNFILAECNPKEFKLSTKCIEGFNRFDTFLIKTDKLNKISSFNNSNECNFCYKYLNRTTGLYEKKTIYYHTFFHMNNNVQKEEEYNYIRVIKLNILSYLATQNLCCKKLILWKLPQFPSKIENELNKMFSYYMNKNIFSIQTFEFNFFCKNGFFKNIMCKLKDENLMNSNLIFLSDMVRFVVLDIYGGIYADGDVVYFKDMRLFWYFNFAYVWGSSLNTFNTAVLGINKDYNYTSSLSNLFEYINSNQQTKNNLLFNFHPFHLSRWVESINNNTIFNYSSLKIIHNHFFDYSWMCAEKGFKQIDDIPICRFSDFSEKKIIEYKDFNFSNFIKGAFAYHYHKAKKINNGSYFDHLERYFTANLNL